ncbi:MAG TPA: calcium-translocating P-type ATPase, PMCA-type [Candidatus Gallimonas intestinavium]|uniref:P-type Ca(2+) transporter n=1 Tax=Candidatus Gallimonas intestinavium TaxID=2838603 RepID=A0A9D2JZ83_9FIRM|nr:calcium-translocating P-type ATPase, PMCA-type [Candidatus Gallimonas intestinavium]
MQRQEFYSCPQSEVVKDLATDAQKGLSEQEAQARRARYGENKLAEQKKKSMFVRFLEQFKDVMIIILLIAACVSFGVICYQVFVTGEESPIEFVEPALIIFIVVLNAIMGLVQESKAEKALEALKNMSAPHARVLRDGKEKFIQASELVPGDVIYLEAGDFVPADARLLTSSNLKSEESALTGESVPAEKDARAEVKENASVGDRSNMVFSGCSLTYGSATAVVTGTGMNTEMGKIANLLAGEKEVRTPLQNKLAQLGKYLGIVALAACAIIFVVGACVGLDWLELFMTAVSLAVSAIPEGLPAVVTIVLSIGVTRMVKKNAIIKRLPAVETLGSASVICSDKTGTLTQNRMTLVRTYVDGGEATAFDPAATDEQTKQLLAWGTLCCDGSVEFEGDREVHLGDPTETAIVLAAHKLGNEKEALNESCPRIASLPFDSDRKLMTTVNKINGKLIAVVKGAFDVMATRCIAGDIEKARSVNDAMSADALRVLAVGYKELDSVSEEPTSEELEYGLTFLGLVGMIDPPRPEAKEAVAVCRKAGIKPVMITGDHVITASAIARELGILLDGDRAITGAELDAMSEEELDQQVEHISVYARVSPENKIRIVKAWQKKGQVVSMTGDGVNDAPALKAADIGCAMGITGTDVAKGAADMTLTDDNFATIVDAVKEGRGIYSNIKKVVGFLLGTNISEVIVVFLAMCIWQISPFISIQLLWINLIGDSLPAIALGMEKLEPDVMDHKPRAKNESIFAHGYGIQIVLQGCMFAGLALASYCIARFGFGLGAEACSAATFFVLALSQTLHAYNMRSGHSLFKVGPFTNKFLNIVTLIALALIAFVMFTPGVMTVFGFGSAYLPWQVYVIGIALSIVPIIVMEIAKSLELVRHHK